MAEEAWRWIVDRSLGGRPRTPSWFPLPAVHDYLDRLDESHPLTPGEIQIRAELLERCVETGEALVAFAGRDGSLCKRESCVETAVGLAVAILPVIG